MRTLAATGNLPIPPRGRRRLLLGYLEDGREFSLAVRGRNVLVTGDAKSGKSWVAGLLCEQLILHGYCVCAIDPEGDYSSLEGLPGVTVLGREDAPPTPRELLRALRYPDRSVVIDLSRLPHDEKLQYIRAVLPALNVLRRRTGLPHRILLDEAHYYLHDTDAPQLLDFERNGYTVVTYCASRLPQALLAGTEVMIVTCESNPAEIEALRARCAGCAAIDASRWAILGHLKIGQAVALPITEETGGELRLFTIAPRLTPHVRHREKYVDVPVSSHRAFVFNANGQPGHRIRTLRQFVSELETHAANAVDGVHHARRFLEVDWRRVRRSSVGRRAPTARRTISSRIARADSIGHDKRRARPIRPGRRRTRDDGVLRLSAITVKDSAVRAQRPVRGQQLWARIQPAVLTAAATR